MCVKSPSRVVLHEWHMVLIFGATRLASLALLLYDCFKLIIKEAVPLIAISRGLSSDSSSNGTSGLVVE